MKKILVLNGSPRENGNTRTLSEAFITRCVQRGYTVKKYNIPDLDIKGCNDCERCFYTGVPCVIEDDFNEIANEIIESDVIVFSLPVYFYSIPGNMKCLIDRFNAFDVGNIDISNKSYAIISCCEDNDMSSFDGIRIPLERMGRFFGWNLLDEVLDPSMLRRGDIDNTDGIRRCKDLADKII